MAIQRMDNVGIVVEDLDAAIEFFTALGMTEVPGRQIVEGEWVDRVVGLPDVRTDIVWMQTADGHGRLELMQFHSPLATGGNPDAPPNTYGIGRIAFTVDDLDATVADLRARGIELVGDVVQYQDMYRLCYLRGPQGIMLMLSEELR